VLLVNFWATWCVPCRKEMPLLVAMEQRLKAKGFQFITVSADEPEQEAAAKAFLEKHKVLAPAYFRRAKDDDAFIRLVDPNWSGALPALLLYGRDGKKVRAFYGEADMKALEAAIVKLF
jgi:thiol-disulfide isomerase/thioredoxin